MRGCRLGILSTASQICRLNILIMSDQNVVRLLYNWSPLPITAPVDVADMAQYSSISRIWSSRRLNGMRTFCNHVFTSARVSAFRRASIVAISALRVSKYYLPLPCADASISSSNAGSNHRSRSVSWAVRCAKSAATISVCIVLVVRNRINRNAWNWFQ